MTSITFRRRHLAPVALLTLAASLALGGCSALLGPAPAGPPSGASAPPAETSEPAADEPAADEPAEESQAEESPAEFWVPALQAQLDALTVWREDWTAEGCTGRIVVDEMGACRQLQSTGQLTAAAIDELFETVPSSLRDEHLVAIEQAARSAVAAAEEWVTMECVWEQQEACEEPGDRMIAGVLDLEAAAQGWAP